MTFAELLAQPGVAEVSTLRGRFGFMAYHGGSLEEATDVIASAAAEASGASYYGVHQPADLQWHIPSILIETAFISNPAEERKLNDSAHQDQLANAILRGIKAYFAKNPPLSKNPSV